MVPIGRYFIFKTLDDFNHSGTSLENLFLPLFIIVRYGHSPPLEFTM